MPVLVDGAERRNRACDAYRPRQHSCGRAESRLSVSDQASAPVCEKCGTIGVPSYLVLSPVLQYWRCPHCFQIWTTLKTKIEQHQEAYAEDTLPASARSKCQECHATDVMSLADVLSSDRIDYFRCRACDCWWMVPKGKDGPATRAMFGHPDDASSFRENDKTG